MAHAIEIRVVVLARQVIAGFAVADGEILAAKDGRGVSVGACGEAAGDAGERTGRRFFVENAVRVQDHCANGGVQRLVGFDVVDGRVAGERAKERL